MNKKAIAWDTFGKWLLYIAAALAILYIIYRLSGVKADFFPKF